MHPKRNKKAMKPLDSPVRPQHALHSIPEVTQETVALSKKDGDKKKIKKISFTNRWW